MTVIRKLFSKKPKVIRGYTLDGKQQRRYNKTLRRFNDQDIALAEALHKPVKSSDGRIAYPVFHVTKKKIKTSDGVNT